MKNIAMIYRSIFALITVLVFQVGVNAQTTMEEFMAKWANGKQFTLEVVDKMPDELLDYRPHESAMSFNEQITHLSAAIAGISMRFIGGEQPGFALDAKPANKAELRAFVEACYDYATNIYSGLNTVALAEEVDIFGSKATKRQVLALIDDHTTHHRGAAISYIRSNGIEPPRFRAF